MPANRRSPRRRDTSGPVRRATKRFSRLKHSRSSRTWSSLRPAGRGAARGARARQARFDAGERPDFLAGDGARPRGDWRVAPLPDRPARPPRGDHRPGRPQDDHQRAQLGRERLHGRLRGLELAHLGQLIAGQLNLRDAVRAHASLRRRPETGKSYRSNDEARRADRAPARLAPAREARHASTASRCPAALFDFGLYFFHNAKELLARGTGPYFYLPKMESHLEARLWNDVFVHAAGGARPAARAPSRPRCSSRRCPPRSRWTRSSTSCASTPPGSTAAAGTTSSASSRSSDRPRDFSCPTARR